MSIVYNTDKRSGITYAYESKSYWDKEKKQSRAKRTLTEQDEILERLKGMKISELKQQILRLELENKELRINK